MDPEFKTLHPNHINTLSTDTIKSPVQNRNPRETPGPQPTRSSDLYQHFLSPDGALAPFIPQAGSRSRPWREVGGESVYAKCACIHMHIHTYSTRSHIDAHIPASNARLVTRAGNKNNTNRIRVLRLALIPMLILIL